MQFDLFPDLPPLELDFDGEKKVCRICSKEKHIDLFPKHSHHKSGVDSRCKSCIKKQTKLRNELKEKYAYLKTDFCDCCGNTHEKSLVLDHDHNTLKFRGWICDCCNTGLGKLGDDLNGVEKALDYLKRHYNKG